MSEIEERKKRERGAITIVFICFLVSLSSCLYEMVKELFVLSLKTAIRSSEYRRNLFGFGLLVIWLFLLLDKSFSVFDLILSSSHISIFVFFLKVFPIFQFVDLIIKILFKNNSLYRPSFFQACPISEKEWKIYIMLCNFFSIWSFYLAIFFLPYLFSFATVSEGLIIIILLWISSILNNGICLWLKNYGSKLYKTFLISFFYFAILGYEYFFIFNNQHINLVAESILLIVLFAVFIFVLYLYIFKQKKVYVAENLVRLGLKLNKPGTSLSLRKMEFIYLFRSKRLLLSLLVPSAISFSFAGILAGKEFIHIQFFMISLLVLPIMILGQYLFAVEANFFNGIWTKPLSVMQLLETKYTFYVILVGIYAIIFSPFILYSHLNILDYFSVVFYIAFILNLLLFPIALYSKRLDLNSSIFFNNQGIAMMPYFYVLILFCISLVFLQFVYSKSANEWIFFSTISSICAIFFFLRKRFLLIISSIFIKRRHRIMRRYMSS